MRPLLLLLLVLGRLAAAVGPDTTVVVINGASPVSDQVARTWVRLRNIPEAQIVTLVGVPTTTRMSLADFRRLVLTPLEAALVQRKLADRITLVAYGPDFPTAITFDDGGLPAGAKGPASLTGLTLLAPLLVDGPKAFTALDANPYAEKPLMPGAEADIAAHKDPVVTKAEGHLGAAEPTAAIPLLTDAAERFNAPSVWYNLACAQALTNQPLAAEESLGKAIAAGWANENHLAQDADLKLLRTRPAWKDFLERTRKNLAKILPPDSPEFSTLPPRTGTTPGRLAILLAPTGPRGLTADEAIAALERSVEGDGGRPIGTVFYMASTDQARTGPRRWAFESAAKAITAAGITAEVRDGILPPNGTRVAGATMGIAEFTWPENGGPRLTAGAWCDHLTSFGGALEPGAGQTPLTAFLRAGAAGAGGTVAEPMNLRQKFPSAFVHLHRVRGLSLVEAVHRSMACPYQYLVVGDPLSRPWPAP